MSHPTQGQNPITRELAESFVPLILRTVERRADGCWVRSGSLNSAGYSRVSRRMGVTRTYYYAHRVMYVSAKGLIPTGYTIDHICEVRACCNPDHLRAVVHGDNVLRGRDNPYAINARKTHCIRGHQLPPYERGKTRDCRECRRAYMVAYRRKAVV